MKKKSLFLFLLFLVLTIVSACNFDFLDSENHVYNDFTSSEKLHLNEFDSSIPFIANDEYYFEVYENAIHYYTIGNTEKDFDEYKKSLLDIGYKYVAWDIETGYKYERDDIVILLQSYLESEKFIIDVVVYSKSTNDDTDNNPNENPSQNPTPDDNTGDNGNAQENISYVISSAMPSGLTYITNNSQYPDPDFSSDGGLKMRFENQGVQTAKFNATNKVVVSININALNENTKTSAQSNDVFTVYGLNASGNTVATAALTSVVTGNNQVTLTGTGIVSVKVIMTGYPHNGNKYCNVSLGGIDLVFTVNGENTDDDNTDDNSGYKYTNFTDSEKALFQSYFGQVVPFIANNEYYLDEYFYDYEDYGYSEEGIYFYTFGNTGSEFDAYRTKLSNSGYSLDDNYVDDYGYTWYSYVKSDFYLDVCFYEYEGEYIVYVYVYNLIGIDNGSGDTDDDNQNNNNTNVSYVISDSFPSGLTYISNSSDHPNAEYYSDGGLKMRFEGQGVQTTKFNATDKVVVSINIKALNENTKTAQSSDAFTVYGLNASGNTVATAKLTSVSAGSNKVTLTGSGIVSVKVIMTGYPYNGNKYCNVSLGGIDLIFNEDGNSGDNGNSDNNSGYTYNNFTSSEKTLFQSYFKEVIPFIANNQYYIEEYEYEDEVGLNFYTYGNTQNDFNLYRTKLENSGYDYYDNYQDSYGDTWYSYVKDDIYLDLSFYNYDGDYVVDIYVFYYLNGNDNGNNGSSSNNADLITNEGKGLPSSSTGVYDVDFTTATNVKNVTEQGYYLDGCPTTGDVKVLVIPVEFSDRTASSLGYSLDKLNKAFNGTGNDTDYYSVKDYFYISSYNQLSLDFVVCDNWFKPANKSTYYANKTDSDGYAIGDQMIMDEALAYLSTIMDLSQFDTDNNSIIDAVVLVTTLKIDADEDFYWAYRYWNYYTDDYGYYYEYDGVSANDYLWVSYQFLYETTDSDGYPVFSDKNAMNTYTFIHEFSHILGAEDYYDYTEINSPLDGCDMMDSMTGDHNAYTKINFGWITSSRLVVAEDSITLTLEDFSKNGDTIIIANNWDPTLGAYQEYYILMYYTQSELNAGEYGFFAVEGVVMYHINASLFKEIYNGETYYDIYNTNTDESDQYGTKDNLIELCKSTKDTYVHIEGYSSNSNLVDDLGNKIAYSFTVDSLNDSYATITFTKNN